MHNDRWTTRTKHNYTVTTTTIIIKTSIQIWVIENWAIYVDSSCCCCCCYCVIVLLQQQQNDELHTCYYVIMLLQQHQNDKWNTTRTRTKYQSTYIFYSMINNIILLLLLLLLLLLCNFVVAKTKLHVRNAKSSTTLGQLDICSQMYAAQMSDEKGSSL